MNWGKVIPKLQRFYGKPNRDGWLDLPQRYLEHFANELDALEAQEDLRQVRILWITSSSTTEGDADAKNRALKELEKRAFGEAGRATGGKGMSVAAATATLASFGMLSEIVEGPPIEHGIGMRRNG